MAASGPTCVSASKIRYPSRAISRTPVFVPGRLRQVALFEGALLVGALARGRHLGEGVGPPLAAGDKLLPGGDAALAKRGHEIPQGRPGHVMGEARIPGDRDAEGQMLVEIEIAPKPALHERERPVDAARLAIGFEPGQRLVEAAAHGIAGIALRHHDKIRVELVLHVDRGAIAGDRLLERDDFDPGALGAALAFDRLIVDAHPGDAAPDAFAHHPPHHHDPAMAGIAVHDHRNGDAVGDPAGDLEAFGEGRGADIGKPGIGADDPAGADEQGLDAGLLHEPRMRRAGRMHYGQDLVAAVDQLLQAGARRAAHASSPLAVPDHAEAGPRPSRPLFAAAGAGLGAACAGAAIGVLEFRTVCGGAPRSEWPAPSSALSAAAGSIGSTGSKKSAGGASTARSGGYRTNCASAGSAGKGWSFCRATAAATRSRPARSTFAPISMR